MLGIAGLLEVGWAIGLEYAQGFTRLWPSVFTVVTFTASMFLLSRAVRDLPIGTAYAVWTGIGALGTALLAMALLGEPVNMLRILGVLLIVAGIAALRLA